MAAATPPPIVVVGASAGGVEALRELVAHLPPDFPGCVLVVLHLPPGGTSALPAILDRAGPLPSRAAREGDALEPGVVMVAVPGQHLVVLRDTVLLTHGPHENGHRPAVDVLFRSAARHHPGRVIAVVLSGSLDDGAAGMVAVRRRGGHGVVQDFDEALYAAMPRAAAAAGAVGDVLPVKKIPQRLSEIIESDLAEPVEPEGELMKRETAMADVEPEEMHDPQRPGVPAGLGCPSCGGALFQIEEGPVMRYRCRVGHAWSPETLLEQQTTALESALWMAIRSLEEKVALITELGERAEERGYRRTATRFSESADDARDAAELVRRLVTSLGQGESLMAVEAAPLLVEEQAADGN